LWYRKSADFLYVLFVLKLMQYKIYHEGNLIGTIHLVQDSNSKIKDRKDFIDSIVNQIPKHKHIGYAGMPEKTYLKRSLPWSIFAEYKGKSVPNYKLPNKELINLIRKTIVKSYSSLPVSHTNVFVFPTFSPFVKHNMGGSTGYTPHKNTIQLYVHPEPVKGWQQKVTNTIAHEYSHSAIMQHHTWQTLLDSLIYEGLAEHFREKIMGGKRSAWSKAVSLKQVQKFWKQLKSHSHSDDYKLYHKVFFEGKEYPKWVGYTIGYEIFKSFLNNTKPHDWKAIVKLNSSEILANSSFK